VSRFWQDAASIFETATAVADGSPSHIAILMDERNGLRIVESSGWALDALRREYNADTAYSVQRTANSVVVQANNGTESCTLKRNLSNAALTNLGGSIPFHLVRPALLA
jgi:hypothetical protein